VIVKPVEAVMDDGGEVRVPVVCAVTLGDAASISSIPPVIASPVCVHKTLGAAETPENRIPIAYL
jgi:hypothetical protein